MNTSTNNLRLHFPMLRTRNQLLTDIRASSSLSSLFDSWLPEHQDDFLNFCTGAKGVKMTYDSFFKEVLNPEYVPERLNDLLLRQYKRARDMYKKNFNYRDIKPVYTIVLFEQSPKVFHNFPNDYLHYVGPESDTGVKLNLLQKYLFIPLDIFRKTSHNKPITNKIDAWLTFLSKDEPDDIVKLLEAYPEFKAMYEDVYNLCLNTERIMNMFSKELQILDENTVRYMIDEMQNEINSQADTITTLEGTISSQENTIASQEDMIAELKKRIQELESK